MSRYIDAKEVEKRIDVVIGSEPKAWDKKALKELKMYIVHAIPTADVVEVVRCKDCKYYVLHTLFGRTQGWCERLCDKFDKSLAHGTEGDDFCGYGERAE